jgi:hypothetical protein
MSAAEIALVFVATLAFLLAAAIWQVRRAARQESPRGRLIREANEMADTARRWDAVALAWDLPAYTGPEPEAALDRLRQAVTDEQHKGEL